MTSTEEKGSSKGPVARIKRSRKSTIIIGSVVGVAILAGGGITGALIWDHQSELAGLRAEIADVNQKVEGKLQEIEVTRQTTLEENLFPYVGARSEDSGEIQSVLDLADIVEQIPASFFDLEAVRDLENFEETYGPENRDLVLETTEYNITALRQEIEDQLPSLDRLTENPTAERTRIVELLKSLDEEVEEADSIGNIDGTGGDQIPRIGYDIAWRLAETLDRTLLNEQVFGESDPELDNAEQAAFAEIQEVVDSYPIDTRNQFFANPESAMDVTQATLEDYVEQAMTLSRFFPYDFEGSTGIAEEDDPEDDQEASDPALDESSSGSESEDENSDEVKSEIVDKSGVTLVDPPMLSPSAEITCGKEGDKRFEGVRPNEQISYPSDVRTVAFTAVSEEEWVVEWACG